MKLEYPETEQQLMERKHSDTPRPKRCCIQQSARKATCVSFLGLPRLLSCITIGRSSIKRWRWIFFRHQFQLHQTILNGVRDIGRCGKEQTFIRRKKPSVSSIKTKINFDNFSKKKTLKSHHPKHVYRALFFSMRD